MRPLMLIGLWLSLSTAKGQSSATEIVFELFRKADRGLALQAVGQDARLDSLLHLFISEGCASERLQADSAIDQASAALALIDTMKLALVVGEEAEYEVSSVAFEGDSLGYRLFRALRTVQTTVDRIVPTDSARPERVIEHATPEDWHMYTFFHAPRIAVVTVLSKYAHDVRQAEEHVVATLLSTCRMH